MTRLRSTHAAESGRRRAFTLIELLVVISIMAVLIALLFPALSGARTLGRRTQNAAQIRGIHQALAVWAGEHRGNYPGLVRQAKDSRDAFTPASEIRTFSEGGASSGDAGACCWKATTSPARNW